MVKKEIIFTDKAPRPIGPYSQAVLIGNLIFLSGQIPIDPNTNEVVDGDITVQTRRVLENIKSVLEKADCTLENVVKVGVYLKNLNDFKKFNEVYAEYFNKQPPARTTVEVSNLPKGVLLEIDVIAYKE